MFVCYSNLSELIYFSNKNSNVTYYILLLIDENFMYFIEQNYDLWLEIHLKACHFSCTGGFIILDITTSPPPPRPRRDSHKVPKVP